MARKEEVFLCGAEKYGRYGSRAALPVKIIIILRARILPPRDATPGTRAYVRTRVRPTLSTHVLDSSGVTRPGRKAICRMTNERRATWVASPRAANGEHRSVSPRARLSSCRSVFRISRFSAPCPVSSLRSSFRFPSTTSFPRDRARHRKTLISFDLFDECFLLVFPCFSLLGNKFSLD